MARLVVIAVGAAIGGAVGMLGALLVWVVFSDSTGADHPNVGGLAVAEAVIVPFTTIGGGVIAWTLTRRHHRGGAAAADRGTPTR